MVTLRFYLSHNFENNLFVSITHIKTLPCVFDLSNIRSCKTDSLIWGYVVKKAISYVIKITWIFLFGVINFSVYAVYLNISSNMSLLQELRNYSNHCKHHAEYWMSFKKGWLPSQLISPSWFEVAGLLDTLHVPLPHCEISVSLPRQPKAETIWCPVAWPKSPVFWCHTVAIPLR